MTDLRPYQLDARRMFISTLRPASGACSSSARPAAAKPLLRAHWCEDVVERGASVLFLAHRREIIHADQRQTCRLQYRARRHHGRPRFRAAACSSRSIQTLHARAIRSAKIELPAVDLLIVDEAHHATARNLSQDHPGIPRRRAARPDGNAMPRRRPRPWRHLRGDDRVPAGAGPDRRRLSGPDARLCPGHPRSERGRGSSRRLCRDRNSPSAWTSRSSSATSSRNGTASASAARPSCSRPASSIPSTSATSSASPAWPAITSTARRRRTSATTSCASSPAARSTWSGIAWC